MSKRSSLVALFVASILIGLVTASCSSDVHSDPRKVVIALFGAMEKNDQAAVAHLLDLPKLMQNVEEDYAVQTDDPRVFTNPQAILEDLTNDGVTKTRWFKYQRIVNKAEIMADHATVEVTFVDQENSIGYITKFGLNRTNEKWRIYSFKTFNESN